MILRLLWLPINNAHKTTGFLYCRMNASSPSPPLPFRKQSIIQRILTYGENKWLELGQFPSTSIKGRIYGLGNRLIERIPEQERMLWRVHRYMAMMDGGDRFPYLPPIEHGSPDDKLMIPVLKRTVHQWIVDHRKWRLIHGLTILPAVLLSVLPFVKLWLAWEVFRTVTHHRALVVSRWLMNGFEKRRYQLTYNEDIVKGIQCSYKNINVEIPDILRKLN